MTKNTEPDTNEPDRYVTTKGPEKIHATLAKLVVPIDGLTPYGRNPRRGDVDTIAESLQHNGQFRAIVIRAGTNEILAGNHTTAAAKQLGWTKIAATFVNVDDDEAARINLADNGTHDKGAGYDDQLLTELLQDLPDLEGTGYTEADVADLLDQVSGDPRPADGLTDPDDAPEPPPADVVTVTRPGDVWLLGPHRLAVGDSRDAAVWDRLGVDGADAVWTDPPYGVSYVGKTNEALTIENDALDADGLSEFLTTTLTAARDHCRPGACWYVAGPAGPLGVTFGTVLNDLGILRQILIWVKDQFVMGRSDYHYRHEFVFYGWVPGAAHHAVPDRTQDTVHEVARPRRSEDHPTMKPVELIERHLENSTDRGDLVVDPFGGSGSTMIAAHRTGRVAALVEIDPRYADVICRRWQEHTGQMPVHGETGEEVDFLNTGDGVAAA